MGWRLNINRVHPQYQHLMSTVFGNGPDLRDLGFERPGTSLMATLRGSLGPSEYVPGLLEERDQHVLVM